MPVDLPQAGAVAVLGYIAWLSVTGLIKLAKSRNHKQGNPGNPNGKMDTKLNAILSGQKSLQDSNSRIEVALGVIATLLKQR